MPQISVIVPVYAAEQYLDRCIQSVLEQTFSDFELILVDDGSPDNCPQMCDEWAKKDSRIIVIHKQNGGLSDARNAGIDWSFANSNSQWITFIDSDDWINNRFLELLYNNAQVTNSNISMCSFCYPRANDDVPVIEFQKCTVHSPEALYCKDHLASVTACCKLYKKELFEHIRYPVGKLHEDMYVTYKLFFACDKVAYVNMPMYCYFQSANSITRSEWTPKRLDAISAHQEAIEFFSKNSYHKAKKVQLIAYIRSLANNIWGIKQSPYCSKYAQESRDLRNKLRKTIKEYKNLGERIDIHSQRYVYDAAYPQRMRWYDVSIALKNKLKLNKRG